MGVSVVNALSEVLPVPTPILMSLILTTICCRTDLSCSFSLHLCLSLLILCLRLCLSLFILCLHFCLLIFYCYLLLITVKSLSCLIICEPLSSAPIPSIFPSRSIYFMRLISTTERILNQHHSLLFRTYFRSPFFSFRYFLFLPSLLIETNSISCT